MSFIGDIVAGRTSSRPRLSRRQKKLTNQQLELGEFQLEELKRQRAAQEKLFAGAEATVGDLPDPAVSQELLEGQLERLRAGGQATPEETDLINQAVARALESGETDIRRFQSQATEQLREELAPQLGLRTGDTPILDRGARIGAEAVRQQGQLVSNLEGQRATSLLNFPLQRTSILGGLAGGLQEFQSQLKQNAFINRLNLGSARSSAGLGLAGVSTPNAGALLQGQATTSTNPALGLAAGLGGVGGLLTGLGSIVNP